MKSTARSSVSQRVSCVSGQCADQAAVWSEALFAPGEVALRVDEDAWSWKVIWGEAVGLTSSEMAAGIALFLNKASLTLSNLTEGFLCLFSSS
ncbi:MAG: hypothetical protein AAGA96_06295 [Verrucomicrobiota bacterium]